MVTVSPTKTQADDVEQKPDLLLRNALSGIHLRGGSIRGSERGVVSATTVLGGMILGFAEGGLLASLAYAAYEVRELGLHVSVVENAAAAAFLFGGIAGAALTGITSWLRNKD